MRFVLYPLSLLYNLITTIRNVLYDKGFFKTYHSPLKTITIGNLQVGGSGKTPMTAFLFEVFKQDEKIAILSRGYGRKTKGLREAKPSDTAATIGDEPLWYYQNLPGVRVVVAESRHEGLTYIEKTDTTLVLLDDAFQHRAVKSRYNIMLSEYQKPFYKDWVMPLGRLRESRGGYKRADCIIITKCPSDLSEAMRNAIRKEVKLIDDQELFFTYLNYGQPYPVFGDLPFNQSKHKKVIALSGIANPKDFIQQCALYGEVLTKRFKDHHQYVPSEIEAIKKLLDPETIIICTEKDAVKLKEISIEKLLPPNSLYALPVQPAFINQEQSAFISKLKKVIESSKA